MGTGKLGTSLCLALKNAGLLELVIANSEDSFQRIINQLSGFENICRTENIPETDANVFILAVNDKNIQNAAGILADRFAARLNGKLIFHCSGTAGFEALEALKETSAIPGIAHPYQAFFYPSDTAFNGISWAVDSDDGREKIDEIIDLLGGKSFPFDFKNEKSKGLYHASAVVASNYMNLLLWLSASIADKAGIPPRDFIIPIARTTLENNIRAINSGNEIPLTGPIARQDVNAIRNHLKSLKEYPELLEAYKHLSRAAAILARENGIIEDSFLNKIDKLLSAE